MKIQQKGIAHLIPILIIVVLGCICLTGWYVYKHQHHTNSNSYGSQTYNQSSQGNGSSNNSGSGGPLSFLPACSSSTELDHAPADNSTYTGIEPMGHLNGEHVLPSQGDHVYFDMLPASNNTSQVTNVYSPGNVTLVEVSQTKNLSSGHSDYLLYFAPCRDVIFEYGHVEVLSSQLASALNSQTPQCQNGNIADQCMYMNLKLKLTSGEQIGTAGGPTFPGNAFDFGAADDRTQTLAFINTSSTALTGAINYGNIESYQHAVCPLSYFNGSLKTYLTGRLESTNAGANGIPACGTNMQDKAGTSQGDWYQQNASNNAGQGINIPAALAFAHYNMDPTKGEVSVGTNLVPSQWGGTQMIYNPQTSGLVNRDPGQISPDGHVYCLNGINGATLNSEGGEIHFDVEMTNATTIKVDYGSGTCAANPSLSNPMTYVR